VIAWNNVQQKIYIACCWSERVSNLSDFTSSLTLTACAYTFTVAYSHDNMSHANINKMQLTELYYAGR